MSTPVAVPSFDELYAAIQALPEGVTGEILEAGVVETMSRPGRSHRVPGKALLRLLGSVDEGTDGGWVIEPEPEIAFPPQLLVPDLAGWRVGPDGTGFLEENPIRRVPDWVCEILSESTARKDRLRKLPTYIAAGVHHVWLVDPEHRLVEVYMGVEGLPTLVAGGGDDDAVKLPPFDLEIALGGLWVRR